MNHAVLIAPEIFLSLAALAVLVAETFFPSARKAWINIAIAALAGCLVHQALFFVNGTIPGAAAAGVSPTSAHGGWIEYRGVFGMLSIDSLAVFFKLAILASMIIVLWLSLDHFELEGRSMGTYAGLILLATVGMMLLACAADLLLAVIGLELLSVASFVLTGFVPSRRSSAEGAIKFFLVGALSTAILLFGISYYYGYFGTTAIAPLQMFGTNGQQADMVVGLILMFIVAGIAFKLTAAPFHMWAPDAFEGAPTPVAAFLSVGPKIATVAFLLRLLANHAALGITPVLATLAAITMTVGNLGALSQGNMKRLLAYSSISHVGYILVAVVAGGSLGMQAAMLYAAIYVFMNLGVFAGLVILANGTRSEEVPAFAGLHRKSLPLALAMVVFLLSMTGIPPLAGFVGKYAVFASVIDAPGLVWLGVLAVLNSVVSLHYYFRIVREMFFREPTDGTLPAFTPALVSSVAVALAVTVIVGLAPDRVLDWVRNVVGS